MVHLFMRISGLIVYKIAEKLLREGNLSVGEIATEIGYTNPNKFTSAFRGEYGMTPTEYKKECLIE